MQKHIAFVVESAHGHINPTLGIASELVKRGHRVTHAVKENFAARVTASGAEAMIYRPLETKLTLYREMQKRSTREFPFDFGQIDLRRFAEGDFEVERQDTLSQLSILYQDDHPDLVIYDSLNPAGRSLALKWNIPTVEHSPMAIRPGGADHGADLVIVSLPRFFQERPETLDDRFHFVGPIYNDGSFFRPWNLAPHPGRTVLVSATTGLLPQLDFFMTAVRAFDGLPWRTILSIGEELDPALLGPLPPTVFINKYSSQPEILEQASLFVGQGGPASTLESLRCGVPPVLIPPSQYHNFYANRIHDLGLGIRIRPSDFSSEALKAAAITLLEDQAVRARVRSIQKTLAEENGAIVAADLIDGYMNSPRSTPVPS